MVFMKAKLLFWRDSPLDSPSTSSGSLGTNFSKWNFEKFAIFPALVYNPFIILSSH